VGKGPIGKGWDGWIGHSEREGVGGQKLTRGGKKTEPISLEVTIVVSLGNIQGNPNPFREERERKPFRK